MQYKTSVHPLWFTVAISNLVLLLTPGLVLADRISQLPPESLSTERAPIDSSSGSSVEMAAIRSFPPSPEQFQAPSLTLTPQLSRLAIELVNDTNTEVVYQLVGNTAVRTLAANTSTLLSGLDQPTTLTFQRPDGGFVMAGLVQQVEEGKLRLVLDETADLGDSRISLTIDPNGHVFLN